MRSFLALVYLLLSTVSYAGVHPVRLSEYGLDNEATLRRLTPLGTSYEVVAQFIRDELPSRGEQRQWIIDSNVRLQRARHFFNIRSERFPHGRHVVFPEGTLAMSVNFRTPRPGAGWFLRQRYVLAKYIFNPKKRLIAISCHLDAPTLFVVTLERKEREKASVRGIRVRK